MYLIDGHNLIGKLPNLSLGEKDDERKLLRMLENFHAVRSGEPILVVFDPARDGRGGWSDMRGGTPGVTVRFAPPRQAADDLIATLVQNAKSPRSITVVSSDNAVKRAVRRHGAKTLQSEEFAALMQPPLQPPKAAPRPPPERREKPQDADVTYWMQFFKEPPPAPPAPPPASRKRRAPAAPASSGPSSGEKPDASGDLNEWLRLFGAPRESPDSKHLPPPDAPRRVPPVKGGGAAPADEVDSVEYWLREMSKKRKTE